jgi:glycosyltransferase involved in cell wall biosynthesis
MNIVFDCERMRHSYTGLFEYCVQLGKALQECIMPDDKISYYVPKQYNHYFGKQEHLIRKSIHKFCPPRPDGANIWHTTYQVSKYMKHSRKIKKVLTIHDLNFLYEETSLKTGQWLKILQKNVDKADYITAISQFTQNDILNHLHTGDKPISVIYNGYHVSTFPEYNSPVYRPKRPFLFSIGTVNPKKNFHVLPCLLKNNDYELILAGTADDSYAEKIAGEAKKHNVENRVKLIGAVNAEDKYWYLKNCKAFLFPSLAEGFGIPPIEAMHFGKPVFLSTKTSLPEIGGQYAYYFDDFDADNMRNIFDAGMNHYTQTNPESLIIRHASQFNWIKSAEAYVNVYKSVLKIF